jgi:DnaJ domain
VCATEYKDYYQIPGLSRSTSTEEIRASFRKLALQCHPDRSPTDAKRTATGLELEWQDYNPSEYPNYVHIGTPPVIGADGIICGLYEDPSIADATIALSKATAEWTTSVTVPNNASGLYVLVSVETGQSKYFVSHVIDITDK